MLKIFVFLAINVLKFYVRVNVAIPKEKGVTQEDVLNDTGIQFSRIEQAKRDIQLSTLYKVCQYFNLSLAEFFNEERFKTEV